VVFSTTCQLSPEHSLVHTLYEGKAQSVTMYVRAVWLVVYFAKLCQIISATVIQRSSHTRICSPTAIPYPQLLGAQITSLNVYERYNYSLDVPQGNSQFAQNLTDLAFCNVTITYTHLSANDSIHVQIWLPLTGWTGRFQGTGGGGFEMSEGAEILAPAIAKGYAAAGTDGGHVLNALDPSSWALLSPGNVNRQLLLDFSSVCLNDMAILGKAVTESYYEVPPKYSYWNGCSTGGRQGFMNAQMYPDLYDGILAASPAINWAQVLVAAYWGQLVMNTMIYPPPCELSAFTTATITACDDIDGVIDGIIAAPGLCNFDPHTLFGQSLTVTVPCPPIPPQLQPLCKLFGLAHTH
jgi:Tannase and feruloyl esterase